MTKTKKRAKRSRNEPYEVREKKRTKVRDRRVTLRVTVEQLLWIQDGLHFCWNNKRHQERQFAAEISSIYKKESEISTKAYNQIEKEFNRDCRREEREGR